eukprot:m.15971 g.15971  ORF g.15971 m.15971 type:complete len:394 (-) comp4551_c0_seq1:123-1304(-)
MDQLDAWRSVTNEGIVLALDVPAGTQFGIDAMAWTTGPRFKGVKMVPKGLHFIYHSAVDSSSSATLSAAPRAGFFIFMDAGDAVKSVWNEEGEQLELIKIDNDDKLRIKDDLQNLDRYLGKYPDEQLRSWTSLTKFITHPTLQRVQPTCGYVSSAPIMQGVSGVMGKRGSKEESGAQKFKDSWKHLQPVDGTSFSFTSIPTRLFPPGCSGADLTKHSMDKSYTLEYVLSQIPEGENGFVGEFQLAFIIFLVGQVFEGFEQWKAFVHLLCSCDDAIIQRPGLFAKFLECMHEQMNQVPSDFFIDVLSNNNFLCSTLKDFYERLDAAVFGEEVDNTVRKNLMKAATSLKKLILDRFGWDVSDGGDDDGEDDPIVVHLANAMEDILVKDNQAEVEE